MTPKKYAVLCFGGQERCPAEPSEPELIKLLAGLEPGNCRSALAAAGVGVGDEVIVSPYTMSASATCLALAISMITSTELFSYSIIFFNSKETLPSVHTILQFLL